MIDPSLGCLKSAETRTIRRDYSSDYWAEGRMRCRIFSRTSGSFCATSKIESYSSTERPWSVIAFARALTASFKMRSLSSRLLGETWRRLDLSVCCGDEENPRGKQQDSSGRTHQNSHNCLLCTLRPLAMDEQTVSKQRRTKTGPGKSGSS